MLLPEPPALHVDGVAAEKGNTLGRPHPSVDVPDGQTRVVPVQVHDQTEVLGSAGDLCYVLS